MNLVTTRTITAALNNDREGVVRDLDSLGRSGGKIWNVARWTISLIWNHTGEIPDEGPLKSYMKNQQCWKDLNSKSSQAIVEELAGAFQSWYNKDDPDANPPGYRKDRDERPRSKKTASNSMRNTSKSASQKARTSKTGGPTLFSANMTPAQTQT